MRFEKLGKRNRRKLVQTRGVYVLEKDSHEGFRSEGYLRYCLRYWLSGDYQNLSKKLSELKHKKEIFFQENPRCQYAVLIGFDKDWAQREEE